MKSNSDKIVKNGFREMNNSSLTVCSIVRDCNSSLVKNIPIIEKIRSYFSSSRVIIFENDSVDGTKNTLEKWRNDHTNVIIKSSYYDRITIPNENTSGINKYFSSYRISKMVEFRNNYLNILNDYNNKTDYVIVVDLDVSKIDIHGIAHSFGLANEWDVVCANGYSFSPLLKKRYHDTYALIELGKENEIQTEESIYQNLYIWSFLKSGMPLIPVYSAFGGLAIYHYNVIKNKKYRLIMNNDKKVEVKCEHVSLCHDIRKSGYTRIFINPNMTLCNHTLTLNVIMNYLKRRFK